MAVNLHVRNLDDELVTRLKRRAARHGRSTEAEHREILRQALAAEAEDRTPQALALLHSAKLVAPRHRVDASSLRLCLPRARDAEPVSLCHGKRTLTAEDCASTATAPPQLRRSSHSELSPHWIPIPGSRDEPPRAESGPDPRTRPHFLSFSRISGFRCGSGVPMSCTSRCFSCGWANGKSAPHDQPSMAT